MIRKGDDGGAHAQNHGRMDLTVGPGLTVHGAAVLLLLQVLRRHRNHRRLLLQRVDVLNDPARHQILPR